MKSTAKRILCALLSAMMVLLLAACSESTTSSKTDGTSSTGTPVSSGTASEASKYPDYLVLGGEHYYPMVKEGVDKSISFTIFVGSDYSNEPMSRYYWQLMDKVFNINCEVTQVSATARDETVSMAFASDNLTDVLLGANLTPTQLVLYGQTEHQLLDLSGYMDETLTPQLTSVFQTNPEIKSGITCGDGAIYAYPYIMDFEAASLYNKQNIRKTWLDEQKLSMPKTLDELTSVLTAFKQKYEGSIPLGGSYTSANPSYILLTALGCVTNDSEGMTPAVRNGEIMIPAGDQDVYTAYLTLMNQYFTDGIIDKDFFTADQVTVSANATAGKYGVIASIDPFVVCPDASMFQQYTALEAMTSKLNNQAFAVRSSFYTAGGCVVSAKAENKELIARWADWMCTNEGTNCAWVGANKNNKDLMLDGFGGWYLNDKYSRVDVDRVDVAGGTEKWENAVVYLRGMVAGFDMGSLGYVAGENIYRQKESNLSELGYYEQYVQSPENGDFYWRVSAMDAFADIAVTALSKLVFFDENTSDRVTELQSVIEPYIETETAKFITGVRPLSELDAYFKGLDDLGFQEYLGYYKEAYAGALKNY